jgi:hypothetical protein
MKSNVSLYLDYFRQMAIRHADLQHNIQSETGDGPIGSQHFTTCSIEEVGTGLRGNVGWPCLVMELYETELDSPISYDIKENPQGAFMILHHPDDTSFAAQIACYTRTELIVNDLLRQIYQDHYAFGIERCTTPFKEFYFNGVSITPVGPICNGEYGYRVVFGFQLHKKFDITLPPTAGRFVKPGNIIDADTAYLTDDNGGKLPV